MQLVFTLGEIAHICGGKLLRGDATRMVTTLSTDSRSVMHGELFIPLKGDRFDGHDFLDSAARAGASYCLCRPEFASKADGFEAVILVEDTLKALQAIAKTHRRKLDLKVACLTGSCGKTMVKELAAAALSDCFHTYASQGNLNNEFGLPLQVLYLTNEYEVAVLELGTNHPGELAVLCDIALPEVGIWTNLAAGHIGYFGSLAAIAEEKSALVKAIPVDGAMILNADDEGVMATASLCRGRIITYGIDNPAELRGHALQHKDIGVSFSVNGISVQLNLLGKHNASNALAALALAQYWRVDLVVAAEALSNVKPLGRRLAVVKLGPITLLDDCYNSNPASLKIALGVLTEMEGQRHLAVLGDMLELGEYAMAEHELGGWEAARYGVDEIYIIGEFANAYVHGAIRGGMKNGKIHIYKDKLSLVEDLLGRINLGDVILVKASRAAELEEVSEAIKTRFAGEVSQ